MKNDCPTSRHKWLPTCLLALLVLAGCSDKHAELVEQAPLVSTRMQDGLGREFRFFEMPARLVVLAPSQAEFLHAIGATDRMVALADRVHEPEALKTLPRLATYPDSLFDWTSLKTLKPDLVLLTDDQYEGVNYWQQQAQDHELSFFFQHNGSLEQIYAGIEVLGRLTQRGPAASELAGRMRRYTAEVRQRLEGKKRPTAVIVISISPLVVLGNDHYLTDLARTGGADVLFGTNKRRYVEVKPEDIVNAKPDILYMITDDRSYFDQLRAQYPDFIHLPAVVKKNLVALPPADYLRPGMQLPALLLNLASVAQPEVHLQDVYFKYFGQGEAVQTK